MLSRCICSCYPDVYVYVIQMFMFMLSRCVCISYPMYNFPISILLRIILRILETETSRIDVAKWINIYNLIYYKLSVFPPKYFGLILLLHNP